MNSTQEQRTANKKRKILLSVGALAFFTLVLAGSYSVLSKIKTEKTDQQASQEQFVGGAETSQQLQTECQKSALEISSGEDVDAAIAEYKKHVESCREVYFTVEKKSPEFRSEGMYPDLVVDIANFAARQDRSKALEFLKFAKTLGPWEFYMGPIVCDSKRVVDAVIESLSLPDEKICVKREHFKKQLLPELQNRNFAIFSKLLPNYKAAWLGLPDSDVGCPEKLSSLVSISRNATVGQVTAEEDHHSRESLDINVVFKSATEDKLIVQFAQVNECLELKAVLVPGLQSNE